ncbi:SRPBCC family protein [Viscerimonas tarda]
MWTKSHSIVTKEVTKEQMWKLWSDVNNWATWDKTIESASLEGKFEAGNVYYFQPKGDSKIKMKIYKTVENQEFTDLAIFPLAKMYGKHTFEEMPEGLKVTTTMTVVGILGFLWRKLVAQKIVNDLPADMIEQIKAAQKIII